jgi:F-type H+-transporting ATPase subunit epsilon
MDTAQGHIERGGAPHGALADHPHGGILSVEVVSPEAILYQGQATSVIAPAYDGLVGFLPRHAPMLTLLGRGMLTLRTPSGDRRFTVGGGFVQVRDNVIRVVAEEAAAA